MIRLITKESWIGLNILAWNKSELGKIENPGVQA